MPSDEILNDPGWQAFHAFRYICEWLGNPYPDDGSNLALRVDFDSAPRDQDERRREARRMAIQRVNAERGRRGLPEIPFDECGEA